MSISAINAVWKLATVKGIEKNVLVALADYANQDGFAFPSLKKLAQKSGWSERAVQSALRELETMKLIEVESGVYRGRQSSNQYVVLPGREFIGQIGEMGRGAGGAPLFDRGVRDVRGGVRDVRGRGAAGSPPLNDPPSESPTNREGDAPSRAHTSSVVNQGERRKIRTSLPDGFVPNEKALAMAAAVKLNPHAMAAEFRDHYEANGNLFLDWQAAFRSWIRKEIKLKAARGGQGRFL